MFRLIIVEDESRLRRHLKEKIITIDPDFKIVGEYENGKDALLEIDLVQPHVVITDLVMPCMNGLELIKEIRERYPEMICAILSGHQDFEYAREAIKLQVNDYLLKPLSIDQMTKFFASLKDKLQQNRSMMEVELFRIWAFNSPYEREPEERNSALALDYFFHAKHILLFAQSISDMKLSWIEDAKQQLRDEYLKPGEKILGTPSPFSNEYVFFLNLYDCDAPRMKQLLSIMEQTANSSPYTFVAAAIVSPELELYSKLQRARKTAQFIEKMELPASMCLDQDEMTTPPSYSLPHEVISKLTEGITTGNKEVFYNQISLFLQGKEVRNATRKQWSKIVSKLFDSLIAPPERSLLAQTIQDDHIEDALRQVSNYNEAIDLVKQFSNELFFEENKDHITDWVDMVEHYICLHYRENLTIAELAERFELNPAYLSRVFKKKKAISPLDLLLKLKIDEAKRMIETNPRSLFKDVAIQLGYEDAFHFSKLFKKWTGFTPTEYKNMAIKNYMNP
ncbi:response regulator transcription factor [Paenibacillus puerhi]|uniref:response regulator transcription factor n=1 Tax=Paenibacillus puerhi TaxID=2692622 RepID=UPI00135B924D|nr:response regulator [Paenibacillus puerhi]